MGLCVSNKVSDGEKQIVDEEEDVPVKTFGKKTRRKRDSIAYNKDAMEKRAAANDGKSKAPSSMVETVG